MKKTYLDLSTGHLSRDTRNLLERYGSTINHSGLGWPAFSLASYGFGCFITVPNVDDADVIEQMLEVPEDLRCCLYFAFSEGAELIRFDADGEVDGDLPYYQEV